MRIFDNLAVGSKHSVNFDICEDPVGLQIMIGMK